jgi:hypothetical protein
VRATEDLAHWDYRKPPGQLTVYISPDYATRQEGIDAMVRAAQLTTACALQDEKRRRHRTDASEDPQGAACLALQELRGHDLSPEAEHCEQSIREPERSVDEDRDGEGEGEGEGMDGNAEVEGTAVGSKRKAGEMESM